MSLLGIVLSGLRASKPPQEILKSVIDGPVSELLREHAISSLNDLFHVILAKLDVDGAFMKTLEDKIMAEATEHLVGDILFKISNTINETQLADQVLGVVNSVLGCMQGLPFAKVFQHCISFQGQAKITSGMSKLIENPLKKLFDALLQEVQASPRIAEIFMTTLLEVILVIPSRPPPPPPLVCSVF